MNRVDLGDEKQGWVALFSNPCSGYYGRKVKRDDQTITLTQYGVFEQRAVWPTETTARQTSAGVEASYAVASWPAFRRIGRLFAGLYWPAGHERVFRLNRFDTLMEIASLPPFYRELWLKEVVDPVEQHREVCYQELLKEDRGMKLREEILRRG